MDHAGSAASGTARFELRPDPLRPGGLELFVDGDPQSHLVPGDPTELAYEYVHRIAAAVDAMVSEPLRILHLGGGAMTLARHVGATRPDARQTVVEIDADLVSFVTDHLGVPPRTAIRVADAADAVADLGSSGGVLWDVIVVDLYRGTSTPEHLTGSAFHDAVALLLAPDGLVVENVADDADLRALSRRLPSWRSSVGVAAAIGPAGLLEGRISGNAVILTAASATVVDRALAAVLAAGPHPSAVRRSI